MRYSVLATMGIVGFVVMCGLRVSSGRVDAQETPERGPHTFAEYAVHALQVGDLVTLNKDNVGGGYRVTLVPKDQFERFRNVRFCKTVKEIHSDYVVFREEAARNTFEKSIKETVVPFHAITVFAKFLDNDSE